ncbi:hypothetical protein JCM5350_003775 [Sporobolomyces pararoseus]
MLEVDKASLTPWLIKHLEPITDAEPSTLAEYVLALLQRDETPQELERICIESLGDFLDDHTEKFVKEMFAFVQSPRPPPPSANNSQASQPPTQRKRPLESDSTDHSNAKRNNRPQDQQGQRQNGGLAKGMCRDYHSELCLSPPPEGLADVSKRSVRGFCARGQACPYQHDAFATAQPPPGAFHPFQFPFGGPQGPFPPQAGMRPGPGMPPFAPMGGFSPQAGQFPGQPGFPPPFGPPQHFPGNQRPPRHQQQQQNGGRNQGPRPPQQHSSSPPPQGFSPPPFPVDQHQPYPFSASQQQPHQQQPPNKRRAPPLSYERPPSFSAPPPRTSTGPPPTPLTVLTHRFSTNASRQKELLAKLDKCESGEEKKEVMGELRKLTKEAEEIMSMKKKIEAQEKEKEEKAQAAAKKKAEELAANGTGEKTEDLQAHLEKLRSEAASLGILPGPGQSNGFSPKPFPSKRPSRTAQSFRLDNRSTNIVIESLEDLGDPEEIKKHFETFGPVKVFESKTGPEAEAGQDVGGEILIGFESRAIAEKAMSSGPPPSAALAKLRWAPSTVSTSTPSTSVPAPQPSSSAVNAMQDVKVDSTEGGETERLRASSVERPRRDEDDDDERSWNR